MFFLSKIIQNQTTRKLHTFHLNGHFRRTTSNNLNEQQSNTGSGSNRIGFARQLLNKILLLRYSYLSYFAAIGGSSQNGPPDLSAKQVSS